MIVVRTAAIYSDNALSCEVLIVNPRFTVFAIIKFEILFPFRKPLIFDSFLSFYTEKKILLKISIFFTSEVTNSQYKKFYYYYF